MRFIIVALAVFSLLSLIVISSDNAEQDRKMARLQQINKAEVIEEVAQKLVDGKSPEAIVQENEILDEEEVADIKASSPELNFVPGTGIRFGYALIKVVPTSRAASHGHELVVTYWPDRLSCKKEETWSAKCIPTAIPE